MLIEISGEIINPNRIQRLQEFENGTLVIYQTLNEFVIDDKGQRQFNKKVLIDEVFIEGIGKKELAKIINEQTVKTLKGSQGRIIT